MIEKKEEGKISSLMKKARSIDLYIVSVLIISCVSFYAVSPSLKEGYFIAWDHPAHLLHARIFDENLNYESLGVWAWYPGWFLGVPPFIFYTPGFYMVLSVLHFFLGWLFSLDACLKILLALSYALFPAAVYWMTRNLGYSKRIGLYAAIFAMTVHNICGLGIDAIYSIGLYNHHFSIVLFAVFLGIFHKTMTNKGDRLFLPAGLLLGFLFISHMITAFYTFFAAGIYFLVAIVYRKSASFKKFFAIIIIAFLSSVFWLYPFLSSQFLFGPETGFGQFTLSEIVTKLVNEDFLTNSLTVDLALVGLVSIVFGYVFLKKRSMLSVYLVVLLLFTVVVSSDVVITGLDKVKSEDGIYKLVYKGFRTLLMTRSVTFLGVIVPLIAAIGLDSLFRIVEHLLRRWKRVLKLLSLAVALAVFFYAYPLQHNLGESAIKMIQTDYREPYQMWNETFAWMKENVPANSMVKNEMAGSEYPYPGFLAVDSMVNLETGMRTLGGNQIEACQLKMCGAMGVLDWIKNTPDDSVKEGLFRFGVDYVLFAGPGELEKPYLEKVYANNQLLLYKVVNLGVTPYEIMNISTDYRGVYMKIKSGKTQTIQIPVQYNDHFSAEVNGEAQPVLQGEQGLVLLNLDPGVNDVRLVFGRKPFESFLVLVSLACVLLVLLAWTRKLDEALMKRLRKR